MSHKMSSSDSESDLSLSECEGELPSSPDPLPDPDSPKGKRPLRKRSLPSKLRSTNIAVETSDLDMSRPATVQCSQTMKMHTLKLKDISREDGEALTEEYLVKGAKILMNYKGKSFQAQFVSFKEKRPPSIPPSTKKKKTDQADILMQAKDDTKKKSKAKPSKIGTNSDDKDDVVAVNEIAANNGASVTVLDNEDKDLLISLIKRVKRIETTTDKIMDMMKSKEGGDPVAVKEEGESFKENGINVLHLPSRDAYAFGLQLLDIMFTKEELAASLLFKSKKSDKPELDQARVERMLQYMEKRYGKSWELKTFTMKANQKCRDSRVRESTSTSAENVHSE